jgi:3-hydroxybutyryl-CoA dehydrogenase
MDSVAVIGAGTMGRGIATATALSGYRVILYDIADRLLEDALASIHHVLETGIKRGKIAETEASQARKGITTSTVIGVAADVDLVIEAVP